ncbi:MAG: metalloregulator ArsR/SmtB family transcription factor [Cyanobacteria bacterium P01_H01_bin.58]
MPNRSDQVKALANESRMEILRLLKDPATNFEDQKSADPASVGVCMNLIAERLNVSQPTISRHIELLKRAGFVKILRQHKWSYCSRDEECLSSYHKWLQAYLEIKR